MSTTNFQKLYEESMYPTNTQFQNTYSTNQPQDGPTYQNKLYQPSSRTKINQYNQGTNFQNYVQKEKNYVNKMEGYNENRFKIYPTNK